MTVKHDMPPEVAENYYAQQKKKEGILWAILIACMVVWGTDIYLHLGFAEPVTVLLLAIVVVSFVALNVTRCPSCNRLGFKDHKKNSTCSVCKFSLRR